MDMNTEKRIDEVMNSLDEIQKAEANPFLYNRIIAKIDAVKEKPTSVKVVWLAAASFILLISLNVTALTSGYGKSTSKSDAQELATGYNLINTNSINY